MKKRKILASILSAVMIMGLFASCSNGSAEKNKTEAQFDCGKKTFDSLNEASDICITMMDSIYEGWRFAIYDADEYSGSTAVREFASEVGLSSYEINSVLTEYGLDGSDLEDFSVAVSVISEVFENNGTIETLDNALAAAKDELKTMTAEYSDYSEYPTLKSYYSKVSSYAEFVKEPSGSFEQLKSTIEDYENEIRTYRSDLEFIFEE